MEQSHFTVITARPIPICPNSRQYVTFLASNGTDALLYSTAGGACVTGSIHRTNGMTNEGISLPSGYSDYSNCNVNPTTSKIVLDDSMAFWNGLSWMILQGKSIYKITDP